MIPYPEDQFLRDVGALLTLNGWRWCHFRPARRKHGRWETAIVGDKGFPDIVAVRPHRLLFIELKGIGKDGRRGQLTPDQEEWIALLEAVRLADDIGPTINPGVEVYSWWPTDLSQITAALK